MYKIAFDYPRITLFLKRFFLFDCTWAARLSIPGLREFIRGLAKGVFLAQSSKRGGLMTTAKT
jgi:hypothetical protein